MSSSRQSLGFAETAFNSAAVLAHFGITPAESKDSKPQRTREFRSPAKKNTWPPRLRMAAMRHQNQNQFLPANAEAGRPGPTMIFTSIIRAVCHVNESKTSLQLQLVTVDIVVQPGI